MTSSYSKLTLTSAHLSFIHGHAPQDLVATRAADTSHTRCKARLRWSAASLTRRGGRRGGAERRANKVPTSFIVRLTELRWRLRERHIGESPRAITHDATISAPVASCVSRRGSRSDGSVPSWLTPHAQWPTRRASPTPPPLGLLLATQHVFPPRAEDSARSVATRVAGH